MILSSAFLSRSIACAFKVTRQDTYKSKAVRLWQKVGRVTDRTNVYLDEVIPGANCFSVLNQPVVLVRCLALLAADCCHSQPGFLLLYHPDDLRLSETALSHSSAPSRLGRLYIRLRELPGGRSAGHVIYDVQDAEPPSAAELIMHEIE